MARIAFLDRMPWDYRVDTPYRHPLGGSQSALCYLAEALAALGHEVRTVTQTLSPGRVLGVDCLSARDGGVELFRSADVVIVLNDPDPEMARALRTVIGLEALLLLWTQHDVDQPAIRPLADAGVQAAWDAVVLVSEWQRRAYTETFSLDPARSFVFGNAIAPAFAGLFRPGESVLNAKAGPPRLTYTSTPFRGLDVLLAAFPYIRARLPEAQLLVHSSLGVYQVAAAEDGFGALYERCRTMLGVDYRGSVSQPALAAALRGTLCFAYPSTFAETFCTAALEAMAAGCLAVVGDLGALSETTLGLAELVPPSTDPDEYARHFAERVVQTLTMDPVLLADRLQRQVEHLAVSATWPARADAWSRWLATMLAARRS